MTSIAVAALGVPIPLVIGKTVDILGGLAPPMSLLLIGASLSLKLLRQYLRSTLGAIILKLFLLPAGGLLLFIQFHLRPEDYLPALILLCTPTATLSYIMAKEMHDDADFAVATISASTLLSSISFMIWLAYVSHLAG